MTDEDVSSVSRRCIIIIKQTNNNIQIIIIYIYENERYQSPIITIILAQRQRRLIMAIGRAPAVSSDNGGGGIGNNKLYNKYIDIPTIRNALPKIQYTLELGQRPQRANTIILTKDNKSFYLEN